MTEDGDVQNGKREVGEGDVRKRFTDDRVLFICVFTVIAWAALVSSDAMTNVLPYGLVVGTFDLFRTMATVATGLIAYLAFRWWRRPEIAKRKGDVAQDLLRLSQKLETATLGARDGSLHVHFDNQPFTLDEKIEAAEATLRDKTRAGDRQTLSRLADELHTYRAEAKVLFADSNGLAQMDAFEATCRRVVTMFNSLVDPVHRNMVGDEAYGEYLDGILAVGGVTFIYDYQIGEDNDAFGTEVRTEGDALRETLMKYMVG